MNDQGFFNKTIISSSGRMNAPNDEDFTEEDVWALNIMTDREVSSRKAKRSPEEGYYYHYSAAPAPPAYRRISSVVPKVIPRANGGGHQHQRKTAAMMTHCPRASVPVKIPQSYRSDDEDEDENENGDEMWLPPHEFIARRLSKRGVLSCSMSEGVGRTLKGRDLSVFRNAALSKIGFLE